MEDDNDAIGNALSQRRIPHSRSKGKQRGGRGKGKGTSNDGAFNPLRAMGYYEIQLGSSNKRARQRQQDQGSASSWLEIHELTEEDDGLVGTFSLDGKISGMCLLAGSRKGLAHIVDELERTKGEDDDDDDDDTDSNSKNENEDVEETVNVQASNPAEVEQQQTNQNNEDNIHSDNNGNIEEEPSDSDNNPTEQSSLEISDAKLNSRFHAFEKNSFRNPKFWLRWKGHILKSPNQPQPESDQGYLIFTGNDCAKFEGTISCTAFGWDNLKISGWKTRSRAGGCPVRWSDF